MRARRAVFAGSLFLLLATSPARAARKPETRTVTSHGTERRYVLYAPDSARSGDPAPLLVLLHGSGRDGMSLVERWLELAEKHRIVLAGPEAVASKSWGFPGDGPDFLRDVVDDAAGFLPIDRKRVLLFGHSAGASFAIQMALIESEYFAAAAVSAGALPPGAEDVIAYATRKVPIAIFVGDKDPFFPLDKVRATKEALAAKGIPVELTELPKHDHNYYRIAPRINDAAWSFLAGKKLDAEPKYQVYSAR